LADGTDDFARCLREAGDHARERLLALEALAKQCDELAAMDFAFLFNPARDLFSTGFNVTERRFDTGFYDLLASEARLCSYVAIALGQVPQDHWFSMGRLLVAARGEPILISWSGSMFEYLMPLLVMPNYENTLARPHLPAAVQQQIEYGKLRGVPWGISESGYNRTDVQFNYQYRAFGVPGLGLKRGLAEDLVIAPYATAMALMVSPVAACENLQRLAADGARRRLWFYEAVDYTPSRLPPDETSATIKSFMAHHQGMSLLALVNLLRDCPMQRRFMACPLLKAADLLLQERVPKTAASVFIEDLKLEESRTPSGEGRKRDARFHESHHAGAGGSSAFQRPLSCRHQQRRRRLQSLARTGGHPLARRRHARLLGDVCLSARPGTGEFWSTAYQPTLKMTKGYEAIFTQARAEFRHRHAGLEIHTEISVSPEDDVELRRITITNRSPVTRRLN
jgi:cyclic beta-1,2-glucan synthetase